MRVLCCTGAFANLTSAQTGAAMARAWAELGAQCAVVPIGETGKGFAQAWTDLTEGRDAGLALLVTAGEGDPAGSQAVGVQLAAAVAHAAARAQPVPEIWLEVPDFDWADGGAGFWRAIEAVRAELSGVPIHLVTTAAQAGLHLTGLRGITAAGMHASGAHPGELLAADQELVDWCAELGDPSLGTAPGAGAVGGLGAAVLALGGDVVTGPAECARLAGLAHTARRCDLVVTGYDELEFGTKGGDLLPLVTDLAEQASRPVVALARRNWISARELRTMGIEEGYSLARDGGGLDQQGITAAARPVARTWSW
ncbi:MULTISPECIES: glycerate kinase [unclassified Luteococcus]|uniref:glycerate kinase n=1 Tax=unclassified Luteococcus TaxID=2639923 RepID=UPI00313EFA0C